MKKFQSIRNVIQKRYCLKKYSHTIKFVGQEKKEKKILVQKTKKGWSKIFGSEKFDLKKISVKKYFYPKKILVKKNFGQKKFWSNKILVKKM